MIPRGGDWRDEYGRYQAIAINEEGIVQSNVLADFWLDTNWRWTEELPNAMHCFVKIVGPDALAVSP